MQSYWNARFLDFSLLSYCGRCTGLLCVICLFFFFFPIITLPPPPYFYIGGHAVFCEFVGYFIVLYTAFIPLLYFIKARGVTIKQVVFFTSELHILFQLSVFFELSFFTSFLESNNCMPTS